MTCESDNTKKAVLHLLKQGTATYAEIAKLTGRSRQLIALWAKDIPNARAEYLRLQWEKALKAVNKEQ